jgi:hypothetical protein
MPTTHDVVDLRQQSSAESLARQAIIQRLVAASAAAPAAAAPAAAAPTPDLTTPCTADARFTSVRPRFFFFSFFLLIFQSSFVSHLLELSRFSFLIGLGRRVPWLKSLPKLHQFSNTYLPTSGVRISNAQTADLFGLQCANMRAPIKN